MNPSVSILKKLATGYKTRNGQTSARLLLAIALSGLAGACDRLPPPDANGQAGANLGQWAPSPEQVVTTKSPTDSGELSDAGGDIHATHDCRTAHTGARPQVPMVSALPEPARHDVDEVSLSSHQQGVRLRRQFGVWRVTGNNGCDIDARYVEALIEHLIALDGELVSNDDPPKFTISVSASVDGKRVFEMDFAPPVDGKQFAQLRNGGILELFNLRQEFLSASRDAWCRTAQSNR